MSNHFKEITITNFRGFDSLDINNLRKLNVFVGANNVGKTGSRIYAKRYVESAHFQSGKLPQRDYIQQHRQQQVFVS